ncbi:hypothetical protein L1987_23117 [Smallanthus sonchifolius]|uniref:Uncharacterized protein n=1 Tax=Smallanthus sonchifolius TaxID=185202 RepID=A0ACB9IJE4_9ASTR|nr:hypothetical protein L1987_23117 [Smallanthus sonchifolius]
MKSIQISIWELIPPPPANQVYQTHKVEDQPMPIVALASAVANASRNHQIEVLQSPDAFKTKVAEPVLRNVEAIKRFMRSSRKNPFLDSRDLCVEGYSGIKLSNTEEQSVEIGL